MHLLYFESKDGKFRFYAKHAVYMPNGKIWYIQFSNRKHRDFDYKLHIIDNEDEANEISIYIMTGLLNKTRYKTLIDYGYNFVVKKL